MDLAERRQRERRPWGTFQDCGAQALRLRTDPLSAGLRPPVAPRPPERVRRGRFPARTRSSWRGSGRCRIRSGFGSSYPIPHDDGRSRRKPIKGRRWRPGRCSGGLSPAMISTAPSPPPCGAGAPESSASGRPPCAEGPTAHADPPRHRGASRRRIRTRRALSHRPG